ncbi:AAA ATPase midasin [Entomophthora muscae]|uniref:AAA ATPase midasin n=1 Tax=Entomophthora muscae TaxID=34485 RepID=A0ACC2UP18_9FUNG|nr:AAA ATPase midasin [Entomophthora muscae]
MLKFSSVQELEKQHKSILKSHEHSLTWELSHFTKSLSSEVANVGDVLLFKSAETPPEPAKLVLVETTKRNLQDIALALSMGAPVLLEGGTGVGKTALVEEVARAVSKTGSIFYCFF